MMNRSNKLQRIKFDHRMILGGLTVAVVVWVTYHPALRIQFYDSFWYLIWSATMDLPRFLIQFLDPANITQGYRPVQGLYMYLLYQLFQFNPDGYHWAHTLLHSANAVLFFLIVGKLSKRWRLAFIAAVIYAVLPNYSLAVFWHAVVDPLACFFYLLTILLWTRFLDTQRPRDYVLAFIAFVFALFSKEIALFLPLFLFLIEWWFYGFKPNLHIDLPRYAPFLVTFVPYLWLVYQVQSHGEFIGQFGFRIGPHMLNNLIPYVAVLTFPWLTNFPTGLVTYIWLAIVIVAYVGIMAYKRSTTLLFLALFAVLNVSPVLGFPLDYFSPRYLYLSTTVSALVIALVFETLWQLIGTRRWLIGMLIAAITCVVIVSSDRVAESAAEAAEYTRQIRVPFSDIARLHPTFPPNTYVYFVNSPQTSVWDFEGLFFARYGKNVTVNGTDGGHSPAWRDYSTAYVYYFDPTGKPIEIPVDKNAPTRVTPILPARFQPSIILDQSAVPNNLVQRGQALVTVFTWHVSAIPEKDYTIFAHLVDASSKIIAQYDTPLTSASQPTSQWRPRRGYVNAIVLPIDADMPPGSYRLEIGLYDATTLERSLVFDMNDQPVSDKVVIEPFQITP